jgi:hypothetical protein
MNKKIRNIVLSLLVIGLASGLVGGTVAYFTDMGGEATNTFVYGDVDITVNEDFNPPSSMKVGDNTYKKDVKFVNSGHTYAYARVSMTFSDTNVAEITKLSSDGGNTWYSVADFDNHLPNGWAKGSGALAGYYYYTKPLAVGEKTPSLITNVKTTFVAANESTYSNGKGVPNDTINHTPRDYDIYIYVEGVQQAKLDGSGMNNNYQDAWNAFLNKKG